MIIHIVEQGETITDIANEYGVSSQRIISDNGLFGLNNLVTGQALIILQPSKSYTANENDTLASISNMYNISIDELKQKNPSIAQKNNISPGETITINFIDQTNIPINIYGFLYPNIKDNVFNSSLPFLGSGAVFSYGATTEGNLIKIDDKKIINTMLQSNTSPIMVLTSITKDGSFSSNVASQIFNNINIQNILIENIINTMKENGYVGIDIDFEFVNANDSNQFITFVNNVTTRLNSVGFSVNVDLAPKTSANQKGILYEGHNYAEIGKVSNTVLIMTYEWGYTYSEPMAVAPINQVRRVLEYAISEISNDKIYMGFPNYGYDWTLPYEKGVTKAKLIGNDEAISIAVEHNASIQYDDIAQTPYYQYKTTNGVLHEVWFEDIRSIKAKLDLFEEFNLKGVGYWNLMRSFSQNWAYISSRYNCVKPGTVLLTK